MILQSLVQYYEALAARGVLPQPGWNIVKISYALELSPVGELLRIQPLLHEEKRGEKSVSVSRKMELPSPVKRSSGVLPNFLWDNAAYLLGVDGKGKPKRTKECFDAAKELHLELLSPLACPEAQAICRFFQHWDLESAAENPHISAIREELDKGANLVFLCGSVYPQEVEEIKEVWQRRYEENGRQAGVQMRCLVTGEEVYPQLIHPSIMGVKNAQSSGAALVSFNGDAFRSYGREQNLNAPVGQYAAYAYTTALNYLIAERRLGGQPRFSKNLGDMTVVFWAEDGEEACQDAFAALLEDDHSIVTNEDLACAIDRILSGDAVDWSAIPIKPTNRFYVLGLSPSAARVSVRFFYQSTFGEMLQHLRAHYRDIEITHSNKEKSNVIPLWKLLDETVNGKSNDKSPSPQMSGDTLRAILSGGKYPVTLYQQTELRIRAEREISWGRAAILKGYLLRSINDTQMKEALTVELNDETNYQPYILGRIFSVLEDIQQKAIPGIKATIKDKYFTSACDTPAVVYPTLLKLAESHLRKLETGSRIYYSRQLGELTARITQSYPVHHSLYDQGIFQLGYYHQTQKRYISKKDNSKKEEQ